MDIQESCHIPTIFLTIKKQETGTATPHLSLITTQLKTESAI